MAAFFSFVSSKGSFYYFDSKERFSSAWEPDWHEKIVEIKVPADGKTTSNWYEYTNGSLRIDRIQNSNELLSDVLDWINVFAKTTEFANICKATVQYRPTTLSAISEQTADLCLTAIRKDEFTLAYVRDQTKLLCLEAVKQNGSTIAMIRSTFATDIDVQTRAVQRTGIALRFITSLAPPNGPILIAAALEQDARSLEYVLPNTLQDEEMVRSCVQRDGTTLSFVRADLKTASICLDAVRQNGDALSYVPVGLPEYEDLAIGAVRTKPSSIVFLNDWALTNVLLEAVRRDGLVLSKIPIANRSYTVCLEAVLQSGLALASVLEVGVPISAPQRTEIILSSVRKNGLALGLVPQADQTADLCLTAVKSVGYAIKHIIDPLLLTLAVCLAACRNSEEALFFVPSALQNSNPEIVEAAVQNGGHALQYAKNKSYDICLLAVKTDGGALQYVPKTPTQNEALCIAAVEQNGMALTWVGTQTQAIVLAAMRQNPKSLTYADSKIKAALGL